MFCIDKRRFAVVMTVVAGLLLCIVGTASAQPVDTVSSLVARKFFHYGDLLRHLEQQNSYTIYQGVYQGQWADGDPMIFSVQGSSYRNNKYYIQGVRVDDRYNAGSSLYRPDLESNNLIINYRSSRLSFSADTTARDYIQVSGNFGDLDEVDKSTIDIVHWFHGTGTEGAYDKELVQNRQHTKRAGKVDAQFTLNHNGRKLRQHLYATYGRRMLPNITYTGLNEKQPLYGANYFTLQADGQLPCGGERFNDAGYLLHLGTNGSYGSAHYMNPNEVSDLTTFSATLYGRREGLTTGVTYSANKQEHHDLQFSRNVIDQDGESLYPWSPDGTMHEASWYIDYRKQISEGVEFHVEGYNSLLYHKAQTEQWKSNTYALHPESTETKMLYDIEWESHSFGAGLLENSAGVEIYRPLGDKMEMRSSFDVTLDGYVLKNKSHVMPHWQGTVGVNMKPKRWLTVGVNLAYERLTYNIDHLRYFSNDYLNGKAYFAGSRQLAYTTGGAYHKLEKKGLLQPSMFALNIPIVISSNGHEFMNYLVMKKFIHPWMTSYAGGAKANGRYEDGIYYHNPGEVQYEVGYQPHYLMGEGFKGVPYFIGHMAKYSYTGEKILFGISWQSMMGASPSAYGIGPKANDIGVLDESTASPNTHIISKNSDAKYPSVGRVDQDKAYVARIFLGYNICDWFAINGAFKWTDGQPFSAFHVFESDVDTPEGTFQQQGYVQTCSRGINPTDGDFGCRESAIFNFDVSAYFMWKMGGHNMRATIYYYNIWDFGNVLNEYMFPQNIEGLSIGDRGPNMCLTVPGGLICSLKMEL